MNGQEGHYVCRCYNNTNCGKRNRYFIFMEYGTDYCNYIFRFYINNRLYGYSYRYK